MNQPFRSQKRSPESFKEYPKLPPELQKIKDYLIGLLPPAPTKQGVQK